MIRSDSEVRGRLSCLLEDDLAFRNNGKSYLLHSLHAFAARFPPPLPRHFIEGLSLPGETVLDPMSGSGATLVEGWLLSRDTIGIDLDPLSLRLGKVKTVWIDPEQVGHAGQRVIDTALRWHRMGDPLAQFLESMDDATREFINYWFKLETQKELAALVLSVNEELDPKVKDLFEVLISSIIVTKSGGVSIARDLAHSRPHRVANKTPRNAIKMFQAQLNHVIKAFKEVSYIPKGRSTILGGDCRQMPLADETVDLIVTSPPYANALDYMRAHKFSLVWLGSTIKPLSLLRGKYIGSEKLSNWEGVTLPDAVKAVVEMLGMLDQRKAKILNQYFRDMSLAIQEMYRVIRQGRAVVIVVGPSTMRGLKIDTHDHLAAIATEIGFDVVGVVSRPIDRDKRMMPARWQNNGQSVIEQRMHEEFVLGLIKP